jgi:hypothetical protein
MNPSLLLIPDRYKAAKLYSQIPDSGAGDLTFARNSDATRVNSAGLIEKVRTNLVLQSETFSNATWTKSDTTFSIDTLTAGAGTTFKGIFQAQTTQGLQNIYFDVAYVSHQWVQIHFGTGASDVGYANFDIQNKVVGDSSGGFTGQIQDFGTYVRVSLSINATAKTSVAINFVDSGTAGRAASSSSTGAFKLLRSQLEAGDIATPYIPTTTAAVSVGITADIPRLDYTGGGCPSLLLEPQRANLINFSEQLNNAYWTPNGATISANSTIAPDGTISMDRLTETATSGNHSVGSTAVTIFSNQVRTNSVFVKKGNVRYIQLISNAFSDSSCSAIFDLDTKTVTDFRAQSAAGPIFVYVNSGVEDYGNGILRLFLTNTSTFDNTTFHINHSNVATFAAGTLTDGFITYSGSASSFTDLWGAQVEIGSYVSSYIPTLGSSVTRLADVASKTGISSLIGQTAGTVYVEVNIQNISEINRLIAVISSANPGTTTSETYVYINASGNLAFEFITAGVPQAIISAGAVQAGIQKLAFAYANNDFVFYRNGSLVGSDNAGTVVSAFDRFFVGCFTNSTSQLNDRISTTALYTTRLSNSELAQLTAL